MPIRDTHVKFSIPNLPQPRDIGQTSDSGLFNFKISDQITYNKKIVFTPEPVITLIRSLDHYLNLTRKIVLALH